MEEADAKVLESKKLRFSRDTPFLALGALASVLQPILLLLSGKDVNDAIWPHAYRALQATMFLRENITLLFFLALMLFFTSLITVKSQLKGQALNQNLRRSLLFILGLFSGLTALYFLLDIFYLRGAFLLLPTLYGMILLSTLLAVGGLPRLPDGASRAAFFFQRSASLCHFLCRLVGHARCPGDDRHCTFSS